MDRFMRIKNISLQIKNLLKYYVWYRGNKVAFLRSQGVKIGSNCLIDNSVFNYGSEPWLIEIGSDVSITLGVILITHDGASRLFRKAIPEMNPLFGNRFGPIAIHDNCFIGINTIILPGVEIGPNSIVGAGSVVTKTILPDSVYAGNPAKFICSKEEYISRYTQKMVKISSNDRASLRKELSQLFWHEER